jgi:hypothetical protein
VSRRSGVIVLLGVLAAVSVVVVVVVVVAARPGRSPGTTQASALSTLVPAQAPAGWASLPLPDGAAVLYYPPTMRRVVSDRDAVSVAQLGQGGSYLLYLNATPRQGGETLQNWTAYRLRVLRAEDASTAHEDAAAVRLAFLGGTGSCVIDDYVTRIGAHHYRELACLVQGRSGASVIVAAAPAARWHRAWPVLERAVAAYTVR